MLTSRVPFQNLSSTKKESTIFEQVYGNRRQRCNTISLNVQWVPVICHANIYEQSGNDFNNRNLKRKTFFDTRAIREQQQQQQSKSVTPPSSDYTDAYLSAFAPKLISTRPIRRLTTPIFAHVKPVPLEQTRTYLSTNDSIRTSQTRSNNIQKLNLFDKILPFSSNTNSTVTSNFIPNISTKYEQSSGTPTSSSETQTFDSNYSTSIHSTSSSKLPTTYQSQSSKENIDKPISYPSRPSTLLPSSYKPSILLPSAPLSLSKDTSSSSTNKQTVLPSSNIEKQIDRTETHLFQHDEDIYSSDIEKSLSESSINHIKSTIDPEHTPTEEFLTISSKPIEILENTTNDYDSLINQISDILANVSPLSSTVSSMSPGQSVLDYELTSDGSPILKRKLIESQQSTVPLTNTNTQCSKAKYLIRDDSNDKIVTAMEDLNIELTPVPSNIQKSTTIEIEKNESIKTFLDEHEMSSPSSKQIQEDVKTSSLINKKHKESEILLTNGKGLSSITKKIEDEYSILSIPPLNVLTNELSSLEKEKLVDIQPVNQTPLNNVEFVQSEISLLTNIPNNEDLQEETSESYNEVIPCTKNENHVTDDNIDLNDGDDDDDSSIYLSLTEEINTSKPSIIAADEEYITSAKSKPIDEQQISTYDTTDHQIIASDFTKPLTIVIQRRSTSSDLSQSDKIKTSTQLVDDTENIVRISIIENTTLSSLPIIISPINTLTNSISTRYISSDVYHGYQGEHTQFIETPSDVNTDNTMISILTSLRQIIGNPATPLIETIQSVVSSMQTITAIQPLMNENETIDRHSQEEIRIVTPMTLDSKKDIDEYETRIEENKQIVHTSEKEQEAVSTSSTKQIESMSTEDAKDLTILQSSLSKDKVRSSDKNMNDHSTNEIELTLSSVLDSIQKKVSDTITTSTETIQNIIPTVLIQTSKEHIEASSVNSLQTDNLMKESINLTSQITMNQKPESPMSPVDKTTGNIVSTPIIQDNQHMLRTNIVSSEQITSIELTYKTLNLTNSEQAEIDSVISSISTDENLPIIKQNSIQPFNKQITSTETIQNLSSSTEQKLTSEKSEFYPEHQIQNEIDISLTTSLPQNELTSDSNKDYELIRKTIDKLINDIIHIVISQLQENSIENIQEIPISDNNLNKSIILQINDVTQQLENELESDLTSFITETENTSSKLIIDRCESSATNTEPDSLELVHALQGHSIIQHNEPQQLFHLPEKSFSSTTSSQLTSSDRYVSYAIHQMDNSSQEHLPTIPLVADIPIYKDTNENVLYEPIVIVNRSIIKEDDLTEFDAIDNLTSYTDDLFSRKFSTLDENKQQEQQYLDTSSTDDDVDDEFEQNDLTNIHHIIDQLEQSNNNLNGNDETYQCYDLATSPSSNNSSSSLRQQSDDVYLIPGYPGLWRPSTNNYSSNLPKEYDADDETKTASGTQTITQTFNSTKRPLVFQNIQDETTNVIHPEILTNSRLIRPDKIDLFDQSLNEDLLDKSESNSYQTCQSSTTTTTVKHKKEHKLNEKEKFDEQYQTSPDESIFLIRERERGVSLPVTVKIDCDDITLRLSASTPIDSQLYSKLPLELSSSSSSSSSSLIHSEPSLSVKIDSNSRPSLLSLNSNENDQKTLPSWLNTVKTITTTKERTDAPLESRVTFLKSAKGPISISQCNPQGNYIMIENTSQSKTIDLSNWTIRQENDNGDNLIFTFPDNCHLEPNHSLKILTKPNESQQENNDLIASSLSSWYIGSNVITILYNSEGKVNNDSGSFKVMIF
ncbi:unnamed protein product [Rotaria sordida]|uniref:LTD domain-containing protein n=1 Tax=Rotaria sordida TaxID=392033 RepID=A0A814NE18_9BILA|nr:unnamed protein product [Rotaria sordida]